MTAKISSLVAQGPLTPPGPPAPTMKTLDQVEARTPIDAANAPGDASSLFRITAPGSYYLTGNITGQADKNGIFIGANNVTIDLNGYTIAGVPGSGDGISANGFTGGGGESLPRTSRSGTAA